MAYIRVHVYLGEHGCSFLALLCCRIIQHFRLKGVELCQLDTCKVPLNLLLVHHTECQRLFGYLPVIDLCLHCTLEEEDAMRRQERMTNYSFTFFKKIPKQFEKLT